MSIGSNVGRTFLFGESNPSLATAQAESQGQTPDFDSLVGDAFDDLQQVEGLTREYYVQWINAKNFAKKMWSQYNIDVTNPNPESEEEIRLSQMFQKNMANVMSLGNSLKRGRENEVAIANRALVDPNVRATGQQGQVTQSGDFANTGLTDEDQIIARRVGRSANSVQERDALNKDRDGYINSLLSQLEVTDDPNARLALSERINALRNVSATYDPTQDRNRYATNRRAQNRNKQSNIDVANDQWVTLKQDALQGGNQILEQLQSINNVLSARYTSRRGRDGELRSYVEVTMDEPGSQTDKIVEIDINDDVEGYRNYLSVLKGSEGFKDLNVDDAVLPENLRFRATDEGFSERVGAIMNDLKNTSSGILNFNRNSDEVNAKVEELNNIFGKAINRGLIMPNVGNDIKEGTPITKIDFNIGNRTGRPYADITYGDREKPKTFYLDKGNFADEFTAVNAFSLGAPEQKLPTEDEFNTQWANAKPGDIIVAPNGKRYRKR